VILQEWTAYYITDGHIQPPIQKVMELIFARNKSVHILCPVILLWDCSLKNKEEEERNDIWDAHCHIPYIIQLSPPKGNQEKSVSVN
jgi:hypothetical protein